MPSTFDSMGLGEIMAFVAVLTRFSVLIAVLPFTGDRVIPGPTKILLALGATLAIFPSLLRRDLVRPADALIWSQTTLGLLRTIGVETAFGLLLGFIARLSFDAIAIGGNLCGTFMGFAMANVYDPHQESQSQVVAQLQAALAMLIFLAVDGHHLMLQAALDSYRTLGVGGQGFVDGWFSVALQQRITSMAADAFKFGLLLSAPVAVSIFAVNAAFGVLARALPQMNVLVLSFAVTALAGLAVLYLSMGEYQGGVRAVFERMDEWMRAATVLIRG